MKTAQPDFNGQLFLFKNELYRFAMSFTRNDEDAADLVQDTMLKAIRYASTFESGTNLRSWLYRILKNTFINNYRKQKRLDKYMCETAAWADDMVKNSPNYNTGEQKCSLDDINKALQNLPYENYYPFIRYFEGYKYHEIATELNIPIGTVKTKIHIARIYLKKSLKMYEKQISA